MSERHFVIVCANGRDRDEAQRLGLTIAGVDRVHYLVLATADEALRGLSIVGFALTEWAIHAAADPFQVAMLRLALRARMRPVEPMS